MMNLFTKGTNMAKFENLKNGDVFYFLDDSGDISDNPAIYRIIEKINPFGDYMLLTVEGSYHGTVKALEKLNPAGVSQHDIFNWETDINLKEFFKGKEVVVAKDVTYSNWQ
jgi:hypothetical protein